MDLREQIRKEVISARILAKTVDEAVDAILILADVIVPKGTVCPHCRGTGKDGHDRCDPPNWYICENCDGSGRTAL